MPLAALAVQLRFIDLSEDDTSQNSLIQSVANSISSADSQTNKYSKEWAQEKAKELA